MLGGLLLAWAFGCGNPDAEGENTPEDLDTGETLLDVQEDCANGEDDDGDGLQDCDDPDCETECPEAQCSDGVDNDEDGLVDCEDADCESMCPEALCDDGLDNDGDGAIDCEDSDCASLCPESECFDGRDDDEDGLVDCEDADCEAACRESLCDDGLDNDMDGSVDCLDWDCAGADECELTVVIVPWSTTMPSFAEFTDSTSFVRSTAYLSTENASPSWTPVRRQATRRVSYAIGIQGPANATLYVNGQSGETTCSFVDGLIGGYDRSHSARMFIRSVTAWHVDYTTGTTVSFGTLSGCPERLRSFEVAQAIRGNIYLTGGTWDTWRTSSAGSGSSACGGGTCLWRKDGWHYRREFLAVPKLPESFEL